MTKVTVESYQLRVSNASDAAKVYDISCMMHVNDKPVGNIDGGMVMKNGVSVASFNRWDVNNLNVNYIGVDTEEQCTITTAINEVIAAATTLAETTEA